MMNGGGVEDVAVIVRRNPFQPQAHNAPIRTTISPIIPADRPQSADKFSTSIFEPVAVSLRDKDDFQPSKIVVTPTIARKSSRGRRRPAKPSTSTTPATVDNQRNNRQEVIPTTASLISIENISGSNNGAIRARVIRSGKQPRRTTTTTTTTSSTTTTATAPPVVAVLPTATRRRAVRKRKPAQATEVSERRPPAVVEEATEPAATVPPVDDDNNNNNNNSEDRHGVDLLHRPPPTGVPKSLYYDIPDAETRAQIAIQEERRKRDQLERERAISAMRREKQAEFASRIRARQHTKRLRTRTPPPLPLPVATASESAPELVPAAAATTEEEEQEQSAPQPSTTATTTARRRPRPKKRHKASSKVEEEVEEEKDDAPAGSAATAADVKAVLNMFDEDNNKNENLDDVGGDTEDSKPVATRQPQQQRRPRPPRASTTTTKTRKARSPVTTNEQANRARKPKRVRKNEPETKTDGDGIEDTQPPAAPAAAVSATTTTTTVAAETSTPTPAPTVTQVLADVEATLNDADDNGDGGDEGGEMGEGNDEEERRKKAEVREFMRRRKREVALKAKKERDEKKAKEAKRLESLARLEEDAKRQKLEYVRRTRAARRHNIPDRTAAAASSPRSSLRLDITSHLRADSPVRPAWVDVLASSNGVTVDGGVREPESPSSSQQSSPRIHSARSSTSATGVEGDETSYLMRRFQLVIEQAQAKQNEFDRKLQRGRADMQQITEKHHRTEQRIHDRRKVSPQKEPEESVGNADDDAAAVATASKKNSPSPAVLAARQHELERAKTLRDRVLDSNLQEQIKRLQQSQQQSPSPVRDWRRSLRQGMHDADDDDDDDMDAQRKNDGDDDDDGMSPMIDRMVVVQAMSTLRSVFSLPPSLDTMSSPRHYLNQPAKAAIRLSPPRRQPPQAEEEEDDDDDDDDDDEKVYDDSEEDEATNDDDDEEEEEDDDEKYKTSLSPPVRDTTTTTTAAAADVVDEKDDDDCDDMYADDDFERESTVDDLSRLAGAYNTTAIDDDDDLGAVLAQYQPPPPSSLPTIVDIYTKRIALQQQQQKQEEEEEEEKKKQQQQQQQLTPSPPRHPSPEKKSSSSPPTRHQHVLVPNQATPSPVKQQPQKPEKVDTGTSPVRMMGDGGDMRSSQTQLAAARQQQEREQRDAIRQRGQNMRMKARRSSDDDSLPSVTSPTLHPLNHPLGAGTVGGVGIPTAAAIGVGGGGTPMHTLSPRSLAHHLVAEIDMLDSLRESQRQLQAVAHAQELSKVEQQTVALAESIEAQRAELERRQREREQTLAEEMKLQEHMLRMNAEQQRRDYEAHAAQQVLALQIEHERREKELLAQAAKREASRADKLDSEQRQSLMEVMSTMNQHQQHQVNTMLSQLERQKQVDESLVKHVEKMSSSHLANLERVTTAIERKLGSSGGGGGGGGGDVTPAVAVTPASTNVLLQPPAAAAAAVPVSSGGGSVHETYGDDDFEALSDEEEQYESQQEQDLIAATLQSQSSSSSSKPAPARVVAVERRPLAVISSQPAVNNDEILEDSIPEDDDMPFTDTLVPANVTSAYLPTNAVTGATSSSSVIEEDIDVSHIPPQSQSAPTTNDDADAFTAESASSISFDITDATPTTPSTAAAAIHAADVSAPLNLSMTTTTGAAALPPTAAKKVESSIHTVYEIDDENEEVVFDDSSTSQEITIKPPPSAAAATTTPWQQQQQRQQQPQRTPIQDITSAYNVDVASPSLQLSGGISGMISASSASVSSPNTMTTTNTTNNNNNTASLLLTPQPQQQPLPGTPPLSQVHQHQLKVLNERRVDCEHRYQLQQRYLNDKREQMKPEKYTLETNSLAAKYRVEMSNIERQIAELHHEINLSQMALVQQQRALARDHQRTAKWEEKVDSKDGGDGGDGGDVIDEDESLISMPSPQLTSKVLRSHLLAGTTDREAAEQLLKEVETKKQMTMMGAKVLDMDDHGDGDGDGDAAAIDSKSSIIEEEEEELDENISVQSGSVELTPDTVYQASPPQPAAPVVPAPVDQRVHLMEAVSEMLLAQTVQQAMVKPPPTSAAPPPPVPASQEPVSLPVMTPEAITTTPSPPPPSSSSSTPPPQNDEWVYVDFDMSDIQRERQRTVSNMAHHVLNREESEREVAKQQAADEITNEIFPLLLADTLTALTETKRQQQQQQHTHHRNVMELAPATAPAVPPPTAVLPPTMSYKEELAARVEHMHHLLQTIFSVLPAKLPEIIRTRIRKLQTDKENGRNVSISCITGNVDRSSAVILKEWWQPHYESFLEASVENDDETILNMHRVNDTLVFDALNETLAQMVTYEVTREPLEPWYVKSACPRKIFRVPVVPEQAPPHVGRRRSTLSNTNRLNALTRKSDSKIDDDAVEPPSLDDPRLEQLLIEEVVRRCTSAPRSRVVVPSSSSSSSSLPIGGGGARLPIGNDGPSQQSGGSGGGAVVAAGTNAIASPLRAAGAAAAVAAEMAYIDLVINAELKGLDPNSFLHNEHWCDYEAEEGGVKFEIADNILYDMLGEVANDFNNVWASRQQPQQP